MRARARVRACCEYVCFQCVVMMFTGREDQGVGLLSERQPWHCPLHAIQISISLQTAESDTRPGESCKANTDVATA